jgi:transcriptional regulator with XRE-family HTH domain
MERSPPHYLKEWRKYRRMTQEALAHELDTTKSVISDMERDNLQMSPKWARRIAPILGTTPGHLLDTDPNEVDNDILNIWTQINSEDRSQAAKVLRSFIRTGTSG